MLEISELKSRNIVAFTYECVAKCCIRSLSVEQSSLQNSCFSKKAQLDVSCHTSTLVRSRSSTTTTSLCRVSPPACSLCLDALFIDRRRRLSAAPQQHAPALPTLHFPLCTRQLLAACVDCTRADIRTTTRRTESTLPHRRQRSRRSRHGVLLSAAQPAAAAPAAALSSSAHARVRSALPITAGEPGTLWQCTALPLTAAADWRIVCCRW